MENLIFSLHSTVPVFLVMVVGYILNQRGFFSGDFLKISDKLVFKITLPFTLFVQMSAIDIHNGFDVKYVLFCAGVTLISISAIWFLAKTFINDKTLVGEFTQVSYRSSAAILGAAYITNIYGNAGMVPLMMIGSVPLFNVFAVIILTMESPEAVSSDEKSRRIKAAFINIAKNPIIDAIALGMLFAAFGIKIPAILNKTMTSIGSLTTPLSLITIGAGFEFAKMKGKISYTAIATFIKLMVLPAIFLPVAVHFGFTDQKLIALMVMLGGCSTPTCYVMAKNLNHKGVLSSATVVCTTLFSTVTLTFWIFLFKQLGYII